ncbi:MAG TPA: SDR family oxidoreductase [Vicinamibacterales bacterium]|nr:SDR family oxidoreductase [Vicinamibacterales bacterium]
MKRTALITGASAGIGEAFAEVFAAEGFDLAIVARREDRLQAVAKRLRTKYGARVEIFVLDLAKGDACERLCAEIASRGMHIDALVNNAGYGVPGSYTASPWERHRDFLQVLVTDVCELTYRLLPAMIERGYGRIINVASLAGLVPPPAGHTLYGAAKAFLIKFSEALANEVRRSNVHVTALCPGFTVSEFHDVTGTRDKMKQMPSWMWMDAPTVARQGFDAVMTGRSVYINGRVNRSIAALCRLLPQTLVYAVGRRAGRAYRKA